jgi:hypothetical protein
MGISVLLISAAYALQKVDGDLTIYSLVPPEVAQG